MRAITKPTRTGGLYERYQCSTPDQHGSGSCDQPALHREAIDAAVWDFFERVVLDVDLGKRTVDLTIDGAKVVAGEPLKYAPASPQQVPSVELGVLTDNLTWKPSACTARTDDVTFDVQP